MAQTDNATAAPASIEEIQKEWSELKLRVGQLEAERDALEKENKTARFLLERVIEHRQKSHNELVLLLTGLVSKLPLNDVGAIVARLVEHNAAVAETCAALLKGKVEATLPQPTVLKVLEQAKRGLLAAAKSAVEELIKLDAPFEKDLLQSLVAQPESFFSPRAVRATRCFIKGQVARERVVREFGDQALVFFNDVTTDKKLNPNPKPEEIVLAFKNDFEAWFQQNPALLPDKRNDILALYQRIQRSKGSTDAARAQKIAFQKLSFVLDLLHYYDNQNTEPPDVVFAQRLPALIEQLVLGGPDEKLDEKLIKQAEELLSFVVNNDYRNAIVNNIGKAGGTGKTLKYVLALRSEKVVAPEAIVGEFVRHLIPAKKAPTPASLAPVLRLLNPDVQRMVVVAIMDSDRLGRDDAMALGQAVGKELGLTGLDAARKAAEHLSPEVERKIAWEKIKDLVTSRADPTAIAAAVRARLHAKYDSDEMKQSWITLTEADPISLIRVFSQLPYLPDGSTDPIARAVMETYVTRLTHEKYIATYHKVVNSLKNMFKANPASPTLMNFMALIKWVDAAAAHKLAADVGIPVTTH